MDLGRLSDLMDRLSGMGAGLTITPVLDEGTSFGNPDKVAFVAGWEIRFQTLNGTFTAGGETVREAVDAAFANRSAW
jgi:hypothetical protein